MVMWFCLYCIIRQRRVLYIGDLVNLNATAALRWSTATRDAPFPQFVRTSNLKSCEILKKPGHPVSLSHLQLQAVERRSNCCQWRALFRALQYQNPRKSTIQTLPRPKCLRQGLSPHVCNALSFFSVFFFCLVALHSTPHGALRSAICRGQNTRLYLRYTTQRGGGCVVAQGDVLPICLVGGLQGTEQNGIETPKSRKNLKEEERVCVCVCQCCCERYWRDGPRRYRYREH
ncbi:hypothetical protein BGY98DRAFT_230467 [Russula aff. rugulosa BPL654]|nr:hypothetical protein BGY98DRAFT_230467 [Russula aff. rugulosa BPL654]